MNRIIITTWVLIALFTAPLSAQSLKEGWVQGESNLYKKPFSDAELLTTLQSGSVVTVVKRKGGWYQVKTSKKVSGWMRMSTLRFGESSGDKRGGDVRGLKQTILLFKTGRSGTSGVTVATGIRGLDVADLENSKPDHRALKQLSKYLSDRQGSEKFAASAKLKSRELAYIKVEKPNE